MRQTLHFEQTERSTLTPTAVSAIAPEGHAALQLPHPNGHFTSTVRRDESL